jgi:hypothetical protein
MQSAEPIPENHRSEEESMPLNERLLKSKADLELEGRLHARHQKRTRTYEEESYRKDRKTRKLQAERDTRMERRKKRGEVKDSGHQASLEDLIVKKKE